MTQKQAIKDIQDLSYLQDGWELSTESAKKVVTNIFTFFKSRTCATCKRFGASSDSWDTFECLMNTIGNPKVEYCWKYKRA